MKSSKNNTIDNIQIEMVITDLDGTLFDDNQEVNEQDIQTLYQLRKYNILRTIATGRNLFSAQKRLPKDFPIDYLIFSSGAGIYDWKNQRLIHSNYLPKDKVKHIAYFLIQHQIDFMIHEMIPDNHKFVYHKTPRENPDFIRRYNLYKEFAEPLNIETETFQHASQIIAIPTKNPEFHDFIQRQMHDVKIIRATSPLDGESLWIEIFPAGVSKGHGTEWLCRHKNINPSHTLGVGNDYNDLDLLDFTTYSYIVENAPEELKERYQSCKSNEECGFSDAIRKMISI
jgi:Cof subfamily protein (haloacid dehalogenase superfamily)